MKLSKWLGTATLSLFLLFGTGVLIQAQEQRDDSKPQDEAKPNQQEPRHDAGKSKPDEPRQGEAKPAEQREDKPARGEEKRDQDNRSEDKSMKQQDNSHREQQSGDRAQANSGRRGGHIPDDKFRSSFGRGHKFKVQRPTVVQGQPTFQYGGYSFLIVDAWPADWAYTDDVYIDYIDGEYFLFDLVHPDVRLAIVVVM